ncbi:hypothetical protein GUJ93_ZPchr0011g28537 [Zizania palustris]|uniref:Uncharacterized protein n=1 Tax=Zizania palustris TaxID=103762 RepID=A0A8J5WID5_ZIZPA|nr:hypothetical protein GUJ93_ZPchr0011g28537 [Zizania palustris]
MERWSSALMEEGLSYRDRERMMEGEKRSGKLKLSKGYTASARARMRSYESPHFPSAVLACERDGRRD